MAESPCEIGAPPIKATKTANDIAFRSNVLARMFPLQKVLSASRLLESVPFTKILCFCCEWFHRRADRSHTEHTPAPRARQLQAPNACPGKIRVPWQGKQS